MLTYYFDSIERPRRLAKELRDAAAVCGVSLRITQSQDIIARINGHRDWAELSRKTGTVQRSKPDAQCPPGIVAARRQQSLSVLSEVFAPKDAQSILTKIMPPAKGESSGDRTSGRRRTISTGPVAVFALVRAGKKGGLIFEDPGFRGLSFEGNVNWAARLVFCSSEDPKIVKKLASAGNRAATQGDGGHRVGLLIKSQLDQHGWLPGDDRRFLLDYGGEAELYENISAGLAEQIVIACSRVRGRDFFASSLARGADGAWHAHFAGRRNSLQLEFSPAGVLTIVKINGHRFGCSEEWDWRYDQNWEAALGHAHFEWQGNTPDYFADVLKAEKIEAVQALFWERFAPSLKDPFVPEGTMLAVRRNGSETQLDWTMRGLSFADGRGEDFMKIGLDLVTAFVPDPRPAEPQEWWPDKMKKSGQIEHGEMLLSVMSSWREPARISSKPDGKPLPSKLKAGFEALIAWAEPAGTTHWNLRGVRASGGRLGPIEIMFSALNQTEETRVNAGKRAAAAMRRLGILLQP